MPCPQYYSHRISALAVLIALSSCTSSQRPFTAPPKSIDDGRRFEFRMDAEFFKVSNGMTVAVVPDDKTNLVQVDVRYKVGAAEDPVGKEGLAHLIEHLLFEVRNPDSPATIADRLREATLYYNAWTSWDATTYTSTALAASLESMLQLESERMAADCSKIPDALLAREIEVVRQELVWRETATRTIRDVLRQDYFRAGHPYASTPGGSDASVSSITRDDVCSFMKSFYAPSRAILVISGAVQAAAVRDMILPVFGTIPGPQIAPRAELAPLHFVGSRTRHGLDVREPAVFIAFPYPAWGSVEHLRADLFSDILFDHLKVLEGKKHLKSASVGVIGDRRARALVFALVPSKAKHIGEMEALFWQARKSVLSNQNERFFTTRRSRKRAEMVRGMESFNSRAAAIADYLQYTSHMGFMIHDMEELQKFDLASLKAYDKRFFLQSQSHTSTIFPEPGDEETQETHGQLTESEREMDISPWRAPIDPDEANAPLAIDVQPVSAELTEFSLGNGLRVILAPSFDYPTVDMRLVFPGGDSLDPVETPGLAYWTAHLLSAEMDKTWTAEIWNRVIHVQEMGGTLSATTNDRATVFGHSGLSMYADGLLWKLHWLVESGTLGKSLRQEQRALAKSSTDNTESEADDELIDKLYARVLLQGLFGADHPYAVDRELKEIFMSMRSSALENFRNANYTASGATLIVTGNFDLEEMQPSIKKIFGDFPASKREQRASTIPDATASAGAKTTALVDEKRPHPEITIGFRTGKGQLVDRAVRLVVEDMVEQRMSSIREELGASYGVSVDYSFNEGPGSLVIRGTVNQGKAAAALQTIEKHLEALRKGHDIVGNFVRARRTVLQKVLADTANASNLANELVARVSYDLPKDFSARFAEQVANLKFSEVVQQLAEDLAADKEILIVRGQSAIVDAMLKSIGRDNYQVASPAHKAKSK